MSGKDVALSGITAAFVAIFLTFGSYFNTFDLTALLFASLALIIPLSKSKYLSAFLAYSAGLTLAFVLGRFNIYSVVFPAYLIYFGPAPIVIIYAKKGRAKKEDSVVKDNNLTNKGKLNQTVLFILRMLWCIATCIGILLFYMLVQNLSFDLFGLSIDFNSENRLIVALFAGVIIFGIFIFFLYEKLLVLFARNVEKYVSKIFK